MRKTLFILLFVSLGVVSQAQTINWVTFNEAIELQKKNPKPIFMDVYTDWCGPCKMLDRQTFQNADVAKFINENYYAVKFNGEGKEVITYQGHTFGNPQYVEGKSGRNAVHDFTKALKVNAYPTMLFFDKEGNLVQPLKGFYKPKQIEIYLKVFAKDDYKSFDTPEKWTAYQTSFKGSFVE